VNRWRHRRITFSEDLTPEIADGFVYTDNALPPDMTTVVAQYTPEGGTVDVDRLLHCNMADHDGLVVITGTSTWLVDTVRVPLEDAYMSVYVHPNPADCQGCR